MKRNLKVYSVKRKEMLYWPVYHFGLFLQHPQIQKESQYIKYLCCDDAWTMNLWVTGIRIAKVHLITSTLNNDRKKSPFDVDSCSVVYSLHFQYGVSLHENYKTAEKKAAVSSVWTNRSTPSSSNSSMPSPTIKGSTTQNAAITKCLLMWNNPDVEILEQTFPLCVHWWCFSFCTSQITKPGQRSCSQAPTRTCVSGIKLFIFHDLFFLLLLFSL